MIIRIGAQDTSNIYNFYNDCVLKKEDEEPGTVLKVVICGIP